MKAGSISLREIIVDLRRRFRSKEELEETIDNSSDPLVKRAKHLFLFLYDLGDVVEGGRSG